jgi:hypothetical protein
MPSNYANRYKTLRRQVPEESSLHQGKVTGIVQSITCHDINLRTVTMCHYNFLYPILPASWRLLHTWSRPTAHASRLSHSPHSIKSTKRVSVWVLLFFLNKGDLILCQRRVKFHWHVFHFMWKGHSLKVSSTVTRDVGGGRNIIIVHVTLWS